MLSVDYVFPGRQALLAKSQQTTAEPGRLGDHFALEFLLGLVPQRSA